MTHTFRQLVGRAPISAAEFARRHAAAFTPGDGSGAALTFSTVQCSFTKTGKRVDVWLRLTYPATASGAPAIIAGLPFINGGQIAGLYQTFGIPTQFHLPPSVSQVYLLNPTNQANHTNATLSGAQLIFQGSYLTL